MTILEEPEFNISDTVYHITPDSTQGTVVDVRYSLFYRRYFYLVTFSHESSDWYTDIELSSNKTF